MTNRTELITTAFAAQCDAELPDHSADSPLFRLMMTTLRAASADLAASLTFERSPNYPDFDPEYYFSDSTYNDLSNPTYTINICSTMIDAFYESPELLTPALAEEFDDALEGILLNDDDTIFADLDAITAAIKSL